MKHIGITFSYHDWPELEEKRSNTQLYLDAVGDAGAMAEPLWLPRDGDPDDKYAARLAAQLDGLVVSGGADLPPSYYGEEINPNANVDVVPLARPAFEAALLGEFLQRGKPAFGICYGCQFFNVWRGGSLIQDIPLQWLEPIKHDSGRHSVHVLSHTILRRIVEQEEFEVVTSHHQAICHLGRGAETAAFAPDRLAEAIEFEDEPFFLGVQWHPERDRESIVTQRLFAALVKACDAN